MAWIAAARKCLDRIERKEKSLIDDIEILKTCLINIEEERTIETEVIQDLQRRVNNE